MHQLVNFLGSVLIGHHQEYKQVLTCCHKCIYMYIYIFCNELLTLLSVQCMARISQGSLLYLITALSPKDPYPTPFSKVNMGINFFPCKRKLSLNYYLLQKVLYSLYIFIICSGHQCIQITKKIVSIRISLNL